MAMLDAAAHKLRRARSLPPDRLLLLLRDRLWQRVRPLYDVTRPYDLDDQGLLASLGGVFRDVDDLGCYARLQPFEVAPGVPSGRAGVVAALQRHAPEHVNRTIALADAVCAHVFDLLGSGPVSLGLEIDWHADFKTGWRWPLVPSREVVFDDLDQSYDVKVPWELSRCQLLVTLGQAYWLTDNEYYPEVCLSLLKSWLAQNPVGLGVNWACTMDVAIRAVNLLWVAALLHDSPALNASWQITFYRTLCEHGAYIERNLEINRVLGNHYLADVTGMAWLGLILPPGPRTRRWRKVGLREMWREVLHQFHPDGTNFESSTSYHRLSLEMALHTMVLCRHKGVTVPTDVSQRVECALEFVASYTRCDGSVPQFGDADNGRLLRLDAPGHPNEFTTHCSLLALGAWYFDRFDFAAAAGNAWAEAIWIVGEQAVPHLQANDHGSALRTSRAFPDGGVYIQRHATLHCAISAMPIGQDGNGGHAHNDLLGFELHAHGTTFLRDAGTYIYTADYRARNRFRSTSSHNTLEVDGEEQRRIPERLLFHLHDDARVQMHHWQSGLEEDLFDASQTGYLRLPGGVTHRRQIVFDKLAERWLVRDMIVGAGQHTVRFWLHFDAIPVDEWPTMPLALRCNGTCANLLVIPLVTCGLALERATGFFSRSYGVQEQAPIACYTMHGTLPLELVTVLAVVRKREITGDTLPRWAAPLLTRLRAATTSDPRPATTAMPFGEN